MQADGHGGPPCAVIDACVLIPASLRGLLLHTASQEVFSPRWSEPILAEVRGNLIGKGMMAPAHWSGLDRALRREFPEALVPVSELRAIESSMPNDPTDRHVLAAAVVAGAPIVVTNNLKDFRATDLDAVGVRAMHPDAYLVGLLETAPESMAHALRAQTSSQLRGRWSTEQLLGHLKGLGRAQAMAPQFAARAEQVFGLRATAPPPRPAVRDTPSRGRTKTASSLSP